jgi:hypothetical protein
VSDVSQGPGWWQASDGRWYPPQPAAPAALAAPPQSAPGPPPQWGAPPAGPPKKANRGCLIALVIVGALVVLGGIAATVLIVVVGREVDDRIDDDGITSLSDNDENPPADDVTVGECGPAEGTRFMRATVEVLNHSSEASNYLITVAFESEDGGRQLSTSTTGVNALGPDQTTTSEANSFQEAPGGQEFSCRITQVERFAA